MSFYIGDVLSCNSLTINNFEEAVIADFRPNEPEPYTLLSFDRLSTQGYYLKLDKRTSKTLANTYIDCMNPHFCYIKNLYNFLLQYEIIVLGFQQMRETHTDCLYLKANNRGNRYIQIFVPAVSSFYDELPDQGMFVYVYDAENFDDLKLHSFGDFRICKHFEIIKAKNLDKGDGLTGVSFGEICSVQQWSKNYPDKISSGLERSFRTNDFGYCQDLQEFKRNIV